MTSAWLDALTQFMSDKAFTGKAIVTITLLLALLAFRFAALRAIQNAELPSSHMRRRWIVITRNLSVLLFLFFSIIVWASELKTFAISLVAVAAAVVLATKELLLCISGSILRSSSDIYGIGDRIEIQELRGDVVDFSLFTTTLLEVGPGDFSHQHTGRAVVIPNSLLLAHPVVNETYTDDYVLHTMVVPLGADDDWHGAEEALLEAAHHECEPFMEDARKHFERINRETGLESPKTDPRVSVRVPEPKRIDLLLRVPVPARRKGRVEQAILRRFLDANTLASPGRSKTG